MKRSAPLTRSAPLKAKAGLKRTGRLRGTPAAPSAPLARRAWRAVRKAKDWRPARAKVAAEGRCRVCGETHGLQAAHVLGQSYDRDGVVQAIDVVPLCEPCHLGPDGYDRKGLNLRPHLTDAEWQRAVELAGEGPALRRVMGAAWRNLRPGDTP